MVKILILLVASVCFSQANLDSLFEASVRAEVEAKSIETVPLRDLRKAVAKEFQRLYQFNTHQLRYAKQHEGYINDDFGHKYESRYDKLISIITDSVQMLFILLGGKYFHVKMKKNGNGGIDV